MSGPGGRLCGSWPKGRRASPLPRVPATPAPGLARSPSASHEHGPDGMHNPRHTTSWRAPRMLSAQQQEELHQALAGPAPGGAKYWRARAVADWMATTLGRSFATQRGWDYLQRLKHNQQVPRPRHALAYSEQQETFKKLRPLLQAVGS